MNIGALLVLAKLAEAVGFPVSPKTNGPTPPTDKAIEYLEIGDKCPQFGKQIRDGTVCIYGKVQPRLK